MATIETDTPSSQYSAMREDCGVLDRSERGKLALAGPDALEFLNGQVTNELLDLRAGEGRYAAFLTHKGKMLGDLRILFAGEDGAAIPAKTAGPPGHSSGPPELLLDTERVALQALFDMIRRFKVGYRVDLHKRTLERGLLSLIGPQADAIAGTAGALAHDEHANTRTQIAGTPVLAVRTDVGLDLLCDPTDTQDLLAALRERGALPVCEQAAECVRVERGRPRYGIDLDDTVIPQEAGLNERAVSFTKGCYVGQETVARLYYRGKPNRHLRGLALSASVDTGDELLLGERTVGRVGSFASSPRLGPIALALVRREAPPGTSLSVGERGVSAEVVELPFPQD
ncbi:MAG TPA: glycine cleavage T C-terminal barrel domain-containing protein [Solirubrobacteraceae bacterium]|nr:glycine cleavage T C-terminal barrel domain-containing protein [Solirubrobacteraceae bacterium]